jgi:hypothetical protein
MLLLSIRKPFPDRITLQVNPVVCETQRNGPTLTRLP